MLVITCNSNQKVNNLGIGHFLANAYKRMFGEAHSPSETKQPSKPLAQSELSDADLINDFVWVDAEQLNAQEAAEREKITAQLREFALTEKLSHTEHGAYGAPKRSEHDVIEIKDQTNTDATPYKILKIKTNKNGLVAEVFIPIDTTQSQNIYINWTGTHNLNTVLADLERAPGEESYRSQELSIIKQLNNIIKEFHSTSKKKANIIVTGHSLGGALAQQSFHSLQRAIAHNIYEKELNKNEMSISKKWIESEKEYRTSLKSQAEHTRQDIPKDVRSHLNNAHIGSLTLGVWNSAGVLKAIENSSNQLAGLITQSGIKQRALFGMVGGDSIQKTGEGSILSNVSSDEADVIIAKIDKGHEGYYKKLIFGVLGATTASASCILLGLPIAILGGLAFGMLPMAKSTMQAHSETHFSDRESLDFSNIKCQYFQNNSPEGRKVIHAKLTNKSEFLQWSPVKSAQKGLHFLLSKFTSASTSEVNKAEKSSCEQYTNAGPSIRSKIKI